MINKIYIYDPFTKLHKFLINNIKYELNDKFDIIEIDNINSYDGIILIFINHHFIKDNLVNNDLINLKKNKYNILYITEPLDFIIEKNFYKNLIKNINPFLLMTYSYGNFNKLNVFNKIIKFYPINKNYFNFIDNNNIRNDNKIVFIGKMNDNRQYIKDVLKERLIIIEEMWTKEEWTDLMNKYLFFINVHRRKNCDCFEILRVYPLLYNGCVVFSEYVNKQEMEIYSKFNVIFYEKDKLLEVLNNYKVDYDNIQKKKNEFRNRTNNDINTFSNIIKNL